MGSDESKKHSFLGNLRWFIYNLWLFLLSKLVYCNKISQCKCLKVLKLTPIWRYKSCSTKHLAFARTHIFCSFTVVREGSFGTPFDLILMYECEMPLGWVCCVPMMTNLLCEFMLVFGLDGLGMHFYKLISTFPNCHL